MERQYLMVRAMTSQPIHFDTFFKNSIVAVGWSDIDFLQYEDTELREKVKKRYYTDRTGPLVSKNLNECVRFKNIQKGDYIIVPYYSGIALCVAKGKAVYSEKAYDVDLANQQKVDYRYKDGKILSVPRNDLSEGLQRRLRVPGMSVSNLSEFSDEIEKLFDNPETYSYSGEVKEKEDELQSQFKENLLNNIRKGKTNLQTGGIGMEYLVKELFECEGYTAKILPKNKFSGKSDADVEAEYEDSFLVFNIYAQVKHHDGYSDRDGIDQVIGALENKPEYFGYFITSGLVSSEDRKYAEMNNITVVDGDGLVDIIYRNIDKLKEETKKKLGIIMIPTILSR